MHGKVLVTGAAGFIGFHVARRLLSDGGAVVGVDNINSYYDPELKKRRLAVLSDSSDFCFEHLDIADRPALERVFAAESFETVIHLAAQAGVRYSLVNPHAYVDANLTGFVNILESCRHHGCKHLIYASSSSVYGANTRMPFRTNDTVDHPISLYAATKKANELIAHSYSHLFGLPTTGLRFFTVYGPWGRPDMAMWLFTKAMFANEPVTVFGNGKVKRDFTYIDDIVECVTRLIGTLPTPDLDWNGDAPNPATSKAPWRVHNIGNHNPVAIMDIVRILERHIGRPARIEIAPLQPGDVMATFADVDSLSAAVGFSPQTPIEDGLGRFVAWFREYHGL